MRGESRLDSGQRWVEYSGATRHFVDHLLVGQGDRVVAFESSLPRIKPRHPAQHLGAELVDAGVVQQRFPES